MVLPLDQAEELLTADAGRNAERFLALLRDLMRRRAGRRPGHDGGRHHPHVTATSGCRPAPELAGVDTEVFGELKPMPPASSSRKSSAARPARQPGRATGCSWHPTWWTGCSRTADEGADTLPLLALTLARLYEDYGPLAS